MPQVRDVEGSVMGRPILSCDARPIKAEYDRQEQTFRFKSPGLAGASILLDEASVTATENILMAAVTAKGQTTIRNAASEPHVQDLCQLLATLGAQIEGMGSNTLTITGVPRLRGGEFTTGADYLAVVSFAGAAAITHGEVRIKNAAVQHISPTMWASTYLSI